MYLACLHAAPGKHKGNRYHYEEQLQGIHTLEKGGGHGLS